MTLELHLVRQVRMLKARCQRMGNNYRQAKADLILIKKQLENITNNIKFDSNNKTARVRYFRSGEHNKRKLAR